MLITKSNKKNSEKTTVELEIKKYVEDNCNLSSPEVQLQLNLKVGRRQLKPEKSGSTANN
jgi:hypothetical protein